MKRIHTLLFTFLTVWTFAQNKEGVVTYESTVKINKDRLPVQFRDRLEDQYMSKSQLLFNEEEAIYKAVKNEEDSNQEVTEGNRGRVRFRMRGGGNRNDEHYTNLKEGSSISKTELFTRVFLIEGGEKIEWKVTGEMEMVAGYQCMKATYMRDTIPVVAWFTPQIPVSLGPGEYAGLPGLILSVDINDGQRTIIASNIALRALTEEEGIVAPTKGKRVTREEFIKIRKEKMEEMREMNGGRGGAIFIRN